MRAALSLFISPVNEDFDRINEESHDLLASQSAIVIIDYIPFRSLGVLCPTRDSGTFPRTSYSHAPTHAAHVRRDCHAGPMVPTNALRVPLFGIAETPDPLLIVMTKSKVRRLEQPPFQQDARCSYTSVRHVAVVAMACYE